MINIMNALLVVAMLLSLAAMSYAGYSVCPQNTYWSSAESRCVNCSVCPVNQIIRRPCSAFEDIRCGPFLEFNNFLQGKKKLCPNHTADGSHHHRHSVGKSIHHNNDININNNNDNNNDNNNNNNNNDNNFDHEAYDTKISKRPDLTLSPEVNPWRTIALSLIGIICTSVVLLLAVVIFIHYFKKQHPGYDKEVIYDTNEPGLTEVCYSTLALDYMQKTRPPHALWMYTPAYHKSEDYLLRCNQYTENEQSAPFADAHATDEADECGKPEGHASNSGCGAGSSSNSQNRPTCSAQDNGQNACSCNNASSDYVFFNPAQNEYLEK